MKFWNKYKNVIYFMIFVFFIVIFFLYLKNKNNIFYEYFENEMIMEHEYDIKKENEIKIHTWIINLDKNKERMKNTLNSYNKTDMNKIPCKRFTAILGSTVNVNNWLTDYAINELKLTKSRNYRTNHYQLTEGGIGCFLSHHTLYNNLLSDSSYDIYLILEDDVIVDKDTYNVIMEILQDPPNDWDCILLGYYYIFQKENINNSKYSKVKSFWGTQGYLINKKGCNKILTQCNKQIDAQIDSYMSWMSITNSLNIYTLNKKYIITETDDSKKSNILLPLKEEPKNNPFDFKGIYLGP